MVNRDQSLPCRDRCVARAVPFILGSLFATASVLAVACLGIGASGTQGRKLPFLESRCHPARPTPFDRWPAAQSHNASPSVYETVSPRSQTEAKEWVVYDSHVQYNGTELSNVWEALRTSDAGSAIRKTPSMPYPRTTIQVGESSSLLAMRLRRVQHDDRADEGGNSKNFDHGWVG